MYMPPSTEYVSLPVLLVATGLMLTPRSCASPLDGLNKPIGESDLEWYHQYFNRLSGQQVCYRRRLIPHRLPL